MLVRALIGVLGGAAIAWGSVTIPDFSRQANIEDIARHIIRGEPYKIGVLMRQITVAEAAERATNCRPIALWSAAIIRLRLVEQSNGYGAANSVDSSQMAMLDKSIRRSLSCSPADPFLWLVLHWVESKQKGLKPENMQFLKMSYELGPNEGWVALKRNPVAFSDYNRLPPTLATDVIDEFVAFLNNSFFKEAAELFGGFDLSTRETIVPHIAVLPLPIREAFARAVYDRGLEIKLPGVEPPDSKPRWH